MERLCAACAFQPRLFAWCGGALVWNQWWRKDAVDALLSGFIRHAAQPEDLHHAHSLHMAGARRLQLLRPGKLLTARARHRHAELLCPGTLSPERYFG